MCDVIRFLGGIFEQDRVLSGAFPLDLRSPAVSSCSAEGDTFLGSVEQSQPTGLPFGGHI